MSLSQPRKSSEFLDKMGDEAVTGIVGLKADHLCNSRSRGLLQHDEYCSDLRILASLCVKLVFVWFIDGIVDPNDTHACQDLILIHILLFTVMMIR